MLKNYLKTTLRSFKRQKSSFLINLIGLSLGLACSILIFLWVWDEMNYDKFHEDIDQIYQVMEHQQYSDQIGTTTSTPGLLAEALKEEFPEFEYASTYTWNTEYLFTKENNSSREEGLYAGHDFFHILSINLVYGNRDQLLENPNSVVLSQKLAKKYFGDANPVGESIMLNSKEILTVTGVFKPMPVNSSFRFDFALPIQNWLEDNEWATYWGNNGPRTIAKLRKDANVEALNEKISGFIKTKDVDSNVTLFVYPFAKRYLYRSFDNGVQNGGRIEYVRMFAIVAIFILLIACINFMNLSTAKAAKRAKEVGIRKAIGANKGSLVGQFIGESMIISFFSLVMSLMIVELFLPFFNDVTDKSISVDYTNPLMLLILLGATLITGLVSGSYPAFYLSSMEAVKTLKGSLKSSGKEVFARKGLVIFQFTLSITLIISTVIIYQQIQYIQTKNLGYNKENLVYFTVENKVSDSWESFKQQMKSIPGVANISRSNSTFFGKNSNSSGVTWPDKDPDVNILFENSMSDYDLIETMGFEVVKGRSFSNDYGLDSAKIIFNETAIEVMGLEDPIGTVITLWGDEREIIGVVKDFNFQQLNNEINPLFFQLTPGQGWRAYVRIESVNIKETLSQIEEVYTSFNTNYPFDYHFFDEEYAALYRSEIRIGELAKYFSVFATFISCLGLFGLSAFTAEQRSKEIGVRKLLGASVSNIVAMLSKEFVILVSVGFMIAAPIAWYAMNQWLANFAYKIEMSPGIFALAGGAALLIALATVSWQAIRAATANPVDSLRSE